MKKKKTNKIMRPIVCFRHTMAVSVGIGILFAFSSVFQAKGEQFDSSSAMTLTSQQQTKTITGTVTDGNGDPIIGANVVVKGSTVGTVTNVDGVFSISASPNSFLVISYLGFKTREIAVSDKIKIDIVLTEDQNLLDEVVVTALGLSREKKALGYAMTELKGDGIAKANVVNPISGLQGKVAGVQINMGSAGPQSSQRILIRGNKALRDSNQPIFVIDGVIVDNELSKADSNDRVQDFGNDLKGLNADDFETISVLKGASATALYGSRAANGVILITTKKGKKGEGLGIDFSHTQMWEKVYDTPDLQNEYGIGTYPGWPLNSDGSTNRNVPGASPSFGSRFDGQPYTVDGTYNGTYQAYKNNLLDMYQTGHYMNTNAAVQGGDDKGSFRFSYSNLQTDGISLYNEFQRNSFSLNATRQISKYFSAEGGFSYINSFTQNPTYQGGAKSPVYDFAFSVPRVYDTQYWMQNYKSIKGDGYNVSDPFGYSRTLFDYMENKHTEDIDNFRAYLNLSYDITSWLALKLKGNIYQLYKTNEDKVLATGQSNYDGSEYKVTARNKKQYNVIAMLSAYKDFENFNISGSVASERWDTRESYNISQSTNGLRIPGQFDLTNSVAPPTVVLKKKDNSKRINSVYGFINASYKNQIYLDVTGRNDWSSALIYNDGSGQTSYFYPSVSTSWIASETFRESLSDKISFAKLRASYAIVGTDCDPYMTTSTGYYFFDNTFVNPFGGGNFPFYKFDSNSRRNLNLMPEKQYSTEFGLDVKLFQNRLGMDVAWYRTNTKNQIMQLAMASETGVSSRWINAGNIQNSGVELLLSGTPFKNKDWSWDVSVNMTFNQNKIIDLADGIDVYKLGGGNSAPEPSAYATVGGAYGDIYTSYSYKRDANGNKLLNSSGAWIRSGKSTKIGSIQPNMLGGFTSTLSYKGLSFNAVLDARFGGDIYSYTHTYGTASGALASSLYGRDTEHGGLPRLSSDGRTFNDGMIPEGVFDAGITIGGQNVSGMTYQQAYEKGLVQPLSAYSYYNNLGSWGAGIRDDFASELSWVALRELSLWWTVPQAWVSKLSMKKINVGLVARNVGYLYNSLPDNIHPEGLRTNRSWEFVESGGSVYSRNIGFTVNVSF